MSIINAYLGAGSGSAVPVGKCQLNVLWNPNDGNNKSGATVTITGTTNYTATTDSSGFASVLVNAGSYTVSVTPATGRYSITPQSVVAESGASQFVAVAGAGARYVSFIAPSAMPTATWSVVDNDTSQTAESGTGWSAPQAMYLLDGDYTLTISVFGVSMTYSFTVDETSTAFDISSYITILTISYTNGSSLTKSASLNGVSIGTSTQVTLLRNKSYTYAGTVSEKIGNSAIATIPGSSFTPTTNTYTLSKTLQGASILYTTTQTITIPVAGTYKVLCIGGGGGGAGGGDSHFITGGGGGRISVGNVSCSANEQVAITIGAGGVVGSSGSAGGNGGTTSFGSKKSASGGGGGQLYYGGTGGAGGGSMAGYYCQPGNDGCGYGGGENGYDCPDGSAIDNSDGFYTSGASSAYTRGTDGTGAGFSTVYGGTGGKSAKGGNAVASSHTTSGSQRYNKVYYVYDTTGAGGGGGGYCGGDGGNASPSDGSNGGHGKGYGSGGGGNTYSYTEYTSRYSYDDQDWDEYDTTTARGAGGGGGLYNVSFSGGDGASGAVQIMWVS